MNSKNTKNERPDYFCIQPFVNVTTRLRGNHAVCCNMGDPKKSPNIQNTSITDFFNSDDVKKMREDLLANKKLDRCKLCHFMEDKGQSSHRQRYNEYWMLRNPEQHEKILKKLKLHNLTNPAYAEIHISNLCNLKCLTCNEIDSSKFHTENKALGISKYPDTDFTKFVIPSLEAIKQVLTNDLMFLDIRGGETLMVPELKDLLSNVPKDMAKKITLKIQSNGTIMPDDIWLDIFKKFKNTKFNISIDGFGDDNHYLRYPSKWQDITKTINHLQQHNIKFIVNTVVSNLNILILDKLLRWIKEEQYLNYFYLLRSPTYYQYDILPKQLLSLAGTRLQKIGKGFVNNDTDDELEKLIYNCNNAIETNKYQWQAFVKEITMRDKHRGNSVFDTLPELKEYIDAD